MYKILIIEDDEALCSEIKEGLSKWGFYTDGINEFENILEEFVQKKPHLVIMDINLPYFDGFYWCKKIRDISKVPIAFLSSRDTNMDIMMAINMGGDDFITKPFSVDILITKIHALIRRTYSYREDAGEIIEYGGAILDIGKSVLIYDKKSIELTKNELKMLLLLMKNQGRIVSRERIMMVLWEDDTFINDNTLTVNVNRLRSKLKNIGLNDFIVTKKGQGYMIA